MGSKVYRADISGLTPEQKDEVLQKLKIVSWIVKERWDANGIAIALDAFEWPGTSFSPPEKFRQDLKIPAECRITDVTGWDLSQ